MFRPLKISVIIPACHRPVQLGDCLARLASGRQALPATEYEVIVSDDSKDSRVRALVQEKFPWVQWTCGPQRGPAANRNHGARRAAGEWLVFLDDDCLPNSGWLSAFAEQMWRDAKAGLLEGRTICPDRTGHPLEEVVDNPQGGNFWSCNLAVRRLDFETLGGFDEEFTEPAQEDAEFAHRAHARAVRSVFVAGALVEHPARRVTLRQLWRRALMIRWFSLFLLKTRAGWAQRKLGRALLSVVIERTANTARINSKLMREIRPGHPWPALFLMGWNVATFTILLPYILYWETRFRCRTSPPRILARRNGVEPAVSL